MNIDPHSPTWLAVMKVIEDGMNASRTRLESRGLPAAETEYERGRIAAYRSIMKMVEKKPPIG